MSQCDLVTQAHPRMPKTVARFKAGPALLYHSRTSITSSTTESGIDLLLKDLRALSKHLNKSFVHFAEELQVLDQLYYKGTNQHRHALFWRHTAEMRKYAHRIHGFGISDLIDTLRYAFFPEGAQSKYLHTKHSIIFRSLSSKSKDFERHLDPLS